MQLLRNVSLLLLLLWMPLAQGATQEELMSLVRENSERMVERFKNEKDVYYKDQERFYSLMEDSLEEVVDFRRIAARVMGRYTRQASKEQREQFLDSFKRSLFNAYAKALVESGEFKVTVLGATVNPRDETRASVDLEIVPPSKNAVPITYSMYHNKDDGKWYIENVIVSGVNVGLAFRDRFEQEMSARRGDISQVIANWSSKIDEEQLKSEKN